MSDDTPPPGTTSTPAVPRWQQKLARVLGTAVCGLALNQLADVVPYLVVGLVLVVVGVVFGLSRLDATAPLVRGLPTMLLRVIVAGIVAATLLPESWCGPVIVFLTALIILVALLPPRRGNALAPLVGISVFSYGVAVVFFALQSDKSPAAITVAGVFFGFFIAMAGLTMLTEPRLEIRADGTTVAKLRRSVTEGSGFGMLAALGGLCVIVGFLCLAASEVAAGILLLITGLAVIGMEVVVWLPERHDWLVGLLLTVGGVSFTALSGVAAFSATGKNLIVVPIMGALGLAMAGGGLSLLDASGTLLRLRRWSAYLIKPAQDRGWEGRSAR
jgi:hypothetical protein